MNKHLGLAYTCHWVKQLNRQRITSAARTMAPTIAMLTLASVAHAQGGIDLSGAKSFMDTVKTFAEYAGAVICLISLLFCGIQMMTGNFQKAVPAFGGALFGAGILGWGAGWIGSLTGQPVSMIVAPHIHWIGSVTGQPVSFIVTTHLHWLA